MQDKTYYRAFEPAFVGANSSVHVCWISCILLTLKKNSFFVFLKKYLSFWTQARHTSILPLQKSCSYFDF